METSLTTYTVKPKRTAYDAEPVLRLGKLLKVIWYKGTRHGYPIRCAGWIVEPENSTTPIKDVMEKNEALNHYAASAIQALRGKISAWLGEHDNLNHVVHTYHEVTLIALDAAEMQAKAGGRSQASQLIGRRSLITGNRFMDWWSEELYELAGDVEDPQPVAYAQPEQNF